MVSIELLDIIAVSVFFICILIFAVGLVYKMKHPSWGERGFLNIMYGLWVKRMNDPSETITAVQTMRNLIMVVTFLSTSLLLLLGLLLQSPSIGANGMTYTSETATSVFAHHKLILFVAVIVFSVTMFLLSLRQMVRFSILVGIPAESIHTITKEFSLVNKDKAKKGKKACYPFDAEGLKRDVFLRAMNRFTFGMRAIFYGIVITLWFVNVYAFIVGTVTLTIFLVVHHDVEPCHHQELPL
ncbi:MAG: DUF599 family protein [Candidatus Thermoplasmatota archaeon]|nr:DUF599 family protein [Candidatus Thermoplasmatota archaeon]